MPRIVFLSNAMDISGGEMILIRLIEGNPDIDATLISPNPLLIERLKPWLSDWVLMPQLLPLRRRSPLLALKRLLVNYPLSIFRVARISRRQERQIIVAGAFSLAVIAWLAARLAGLKAGWMHQHPVLQTGTFDARLAAFLIDRGVFCIPCSKAMAKPISKSASSRGQLVVIPNSVDPELFDPAHVLAGEATASLTDVPATARRVTLVAMITRWKGFHLLVETVALLKERGLGRKELAFLLIGGVYENRTEDEAYLRDVREQAWQTGVAMQLFWLGKQTNIAPFYAASDVVLNCSTEPEPFGITIIEAMAMKRIVLVPDIGGPAEIVTDGMNGFLFESGNARSLCERLEWILHRLPELGHVREEARRTVIEQYGSRSVQRQYTEVFERALGATLE